MAIETETHGASEATTKKFLDSVESLFTGDSNWSIFDLDGAREFYAESGFTPDPEALEVEGDKLYIVEVPGGVTDSDAAKIYSESEGRKINVGETEFRVMDDVGNPGWSADFASLESARRAYPDAEFVGVK